MKKEDNEDKEQKKDKPVKKRKWGSSQAKYVRKSQSMEISTDSLKGIIEDVKMFNEPILELGTEGMQLSDKEEDKRDVKIRRTVVQVVPGEATEEGDKRHTVLKSEGEDAGEMSEEEVHEDIKKSPELKVIRRVNPQISLEPDEPQAARRSPSPARNPVNRVVHIRNLVRPFTVGQLKELLKRTGSLVEGENTFWIDKIKSHCYCTFETDEQAVATRKALHGTRWPISNPKILRVEYASQEELEFHKGQEELKMPSKPAKTEVKKKEKEEKLEKKKKEEEKKPPIREWDRDKLKDRKRSRSPSRDRDFDHDKRRRDREEERSREKKDRKPAEPKPVEEAPAKLLDDLFKKTRATPCIYWLPLTDEQAEQRQKDKKKLLEERELRRKQMTREDGDRRERDKDHIPLGHERERERDRERHSGGDTWDSRDSRERKDRIRSDRDRRPVTRGDDYRSHSRSDRRDSRSRRRR